MKFRWKDKEWYINDYLATQLNTVAWNIKKDWDFVILITGDRMVRVGKSVLAQVICAYLAYRFAMLKTKGQVLNKDAYNMDNLFFDNKKMIEEAFKRPKYSIIHYDEGREGLAASKAMAQVQKDLVDFFTECGQMNHCFVIVAPDFFDLKEMMGVARSEILINVYRKSQDKMMDIYNEGTKQPITVFSRGHFEFFSRKKKAILYDNYRKSNRKWYGSTKCDFLGDFTDQYPLGEDEYRKEKADALGRFQEMHKEKPKINRYEVKAAKQRNTLIKALRDIDKNRYTQTKIAKLLNCDQHTVSKYIQDEEKSNISDPVAL